MKTLKTISILSLILVSFSYGFSQDPIKRVVVEESTGTWCASCGYGSIYFEHLEENYPNTIPIAVHTGPGGQDPMAVLSIELYMLDYFSGSPTFIFDRKDFPHNPNAKPSISASNTWEFGLDTLDSYLDLVYDEDPLATVGMTRSYNSATRELNVTVTSNFIQNATGEFRLNCFIVEDSVTGGSEYNQANSNFSGWSSGPAYLQELIDAPAVITDYVHNHVLRETLGGNEGVDASIPSSVTNGSSYSKDFTFTLPSGYDENNIKLVGLVQRYGADKVNDREIVNANSISLIDNTMSISDNDVQGIEKFNIYPNPVNSNSNLEFYLPISSKIKCELYNLYGQKISTLFDEYLVQGEYVKNLSNLDVVPGTYFVVLNNRSTSMRKTLIVQ